MDNDYLKPKLIFAIPYTASYRLAITKAFEKCGFKVFPFDYLKPDSISRIIGVFSTLTQSKTAKSTLTLRTNKLLIKYAKKISPTILFVVKGENITANTIQTINDLDITTINWFPDNIGQWDLLTKTASFYTHYVSVCQILTQKLNKIGRKTHYLPVAGEPGENIPSILPKYDIVFAGHKTQKRIDYFSYINDLDFHLWGYSHWKNSPLVSKYHGYINPLKMKSVFRQAKIIANVSTGEYGIPIAIANLRTFEATSIGAFVLSEYNPAIVRLFKENKEMVFFRTKKEFREKIIYYLSHEEERKKIAHSGWLRTRKDHTFEKRIHGLFKQLSCLP